MRRQQIGHQRGGIFNAGTLTVTRTTIQNGQSNHGTAGINPYAYRGGIYSTGTLTVTHSTLYENWASNNAALTNRPGYGGGAYISGASAPTFINCTITDNYASGNTQNQGSGVFNNNSTLNLNSCTITPNNFLSNGEGSGVFNSLGRTVNIHNTIVGNNSGLNRPDVFGTFNSQDYNLFGTTARATIGGATGNNIVAPPNLGGRTNNGGPTETHLPNAASPAINAGFSPGLTDDQRTMPRPGGGDGYWSG